MTDKKWVNLTFGCLTVIFTLLLLIEAFQTKAKFPVRDIPHSVPITDNWSVFCAGKNITCNLPYKIENENRNVVTMEKTLGDITDNNSLMIYLVQSEIKVWADDELIYDFSVSQKGKFKHFLPSMYHIVKLPVGSKNTKIKIEIKPNYPDMAGDLPMVYLGQAYQFVLQIFKSFMPTLICGMILIAISLYNIIYSFVSKYANARMRRRLRAFSLTFIAVACWSIFETPFKQFTFSNYLIANVALEVSFFIIPIFLSQFLLTFKEIEKSKTCICASYFAFIQFIIVQIAMMRGVSSIRLNFLMQISTAFVFVSAMIKVVKSNPDSEIRDFTKLIHKLAIGFFLEILKFLFVSKSNNGAIILVFSIGFVSEYSFTSVRQITTSYMKAVREKQQIKTTLEKAQTDLMIAQIRPHFIYNTLTSIQTIIKVDPDYAYELMFDFARYLRSSINAITSDTFIPFKDEIKNIESYLRIEKMRMGDLLSVEYSIEADDFYVAPLSIQPIVENSVKHGAGTKREKFSIEIKSFETDDNYVVVVKDTGVGFGIHKEIDTYHAKSAGIANIKYRIEKQMNSSIDIQSEIGAGTTTTVTVPKNN